MFVRTVAELIEVLEKRLGGFEVESGRVDDVVTVAGTERTCVLRRARGHAVYELTLVTETGEHLQARHLGLDHLSDLIVACIRGTEVDFLRTRFASSQRLSRLADVAKSTLETHGAFDRVVIEGDMILPWIKGSKYELWTYAEPRSCRLDFDDTGALCCRLYRYANLVASLIPTGDAEVAALIKHWFVDQLDVDGLCDSFPAAQRSLNAELIERGELDHSWASLRQRARDPDTSLNRYLPFLEAIAAHAVLAPIYAREIHGTLCLKRPSHGLESNRDSMPVVDLVDSRPARELDATPLYRGSHGERSCVGGPQEVAKFLANVITELGVHTWIGDARGAHIAPLNAELHKLGSPLQVQQHQRRDGFGDLVARRGSASITIVPPVPPEAETGDPYQLVYTNVEEPLASLEAESPRAAAQAIVKWLGE